MIALVSGGSRGLGYAICNNFVGNGDFVYSFARSPIEEHNNANWIHFSGENRKEELAGILGECDVLVNNVGVAHDGLLTTQGENKIQDMIDVNLTSNIMLTKHWTRARLKKGMGGVCVTISSIISLSGYKGLVVYSATKAGLNSFTKAMARELGSVGFRFNAVLPGYFESRLSESLSDEKKKQVIRRTPLGRLATVDDIVPVVKFLVSDDSKFITGQLISVDGGLSC